MRFTHDLHINSDTTLRELGNELIEAKCPFMVFPQGNKWVVAVGSEGLAVAKSGFMFITETEYVLQHSSGVPELPSPPESPRTA